MYIAGIIVHTKKENIDRVEQAILAMGSAEIHGIDRGRIVVTVESDDYRITSDKVLELHEIDGVLSAVLVYQHGEEDI
jgi:nitrate reductase NapD